MTAMNVKEMVSCSVCLVVQMYLTTGYTNDWCSTHADLSAIVPIVCLASIVSLAPINCLRPSVPLLAVTNDTRIHHTGVVVALGLPQQKYYCTIFR